MGLVSPRGALSCSDSRCGSRGEMWILGERALLCVDTKCYSALYWNIHLGHAQGGRQEMSWADNPALGPHLSYPVIHPAQPGLGVILYYLLLSSFSLGIYSLSRSRTEPYFPRNSPKKVSGAMVLLLPNSVISPHPSSCSSLQAVLWRWSELGRVLYHCSPWTATALWPLWLLLPPAEGAEAGWEGWNHKKRGKLKGEVPKDPNQHTSVFYSALSKAINYNKAWC